MLIASPRRALCTWLRRVSRKYFCSGVLSQKTEGYCWRTYFKVLGVLFLGEVSPAFLPSRRHVGHTNFGTSGFANSIRPFSVHQPRGALSPACHVQKLSLQINVELIYSQ